jgi:ribosomal protein L3 glutamine methyltransferase
MPFTSLVTVRDVVRFAVTEMNRSACFFGHGVETAFDEAVFLVLTTLHLPVHNIEPFWDARLTPVEKTMLLDRLNKRCIEKLPLAYVLGETWYAGLRFKSDSRALVPRSLLLNALDVLLENATNDDWPALPALPEAPYILDLCTGGGSIAVATSFRLLEQGFFPKIKASDLSTTALALAQENIKLHEQEASISLVSGDLFGGLAKKDKFDLILCNPPYVNALSMKVLPKEYLHEPEGALGSGADGMEFISRLLIELRNRLKKTGALLLEIGNEAPNFEALVDHLAKTQQLRFEFSYVDVPAGDQMVVLITL